MEKYYTNTSTWSISGFNSPNKKFVEEQISEIQKEHPNAVLHSVVQSSAYNDVSERTMLTVTVVMKETVESFFENWEPEIPRACENYEESF